MKSICIKTNDSKILYYLLDSLNNIDLDNVCFSFNEFKSYKNVIIHYKGNNIEKFNNTISNILSFLVIDNYEESIIKKIILNNYFYFDNTEINKVYDICIDLLSENNEYSIDDRLNLLSNIFFDYISNNKQIVLNGFINFRLKDYFSLLNSVIDVAVNKFIIEREYLEFISLLKLYINSQNSNFDVVHLVYYENNSIFLDENKEIINIDKDIFNAKYLSDITFSSNDYILNTLLTLLPKKIYIHLIDSSSNEFINTLQLVFENRIKICTDCSICKLYKKNNLISKKQL
jgi:putative sporulation protein YtxC